VIEFDATPIAEAVQTLSEMENLQVTDITFNLRGYCPDCLGNQTHT
jgi:Fe2+ or Zn2+ uptake regulation protein